VSFLEHRVPELLDEIVGMYRAAGRPLSSLADDELDASFVDTVEAYIADPRAPPRFRAVNDVAAEYVLRRRDAPILRVMRLKEGTEAERINQPHKRKLAAFGFGRPRDNLPMVVLAFGRYGTIPGLGEIFLPEGSDEYPGRRDKILTMAEAQAHYARWRKWRDERAAEFDWLLLGRSQERAERVVSIDDARARRAAG
jgi:hypothetical protein